MTISAMNALLHNLDLRNASVEYNMGMAGLRVGQWPSDSFFQAQDKLSNDIGRRIYSGFGDQMGPPRPLPHEANP